MATIASLVITHPIFLRNLHPKFTPVRDPRPASTSARFSSSFVPQFNIKLTKSCCCCCFSAADQYPKELGIKRHASPLCVKNHLGIGQPLGRVGGNCSTSQLYPYYPNSGKPSCANDPSELALTALGIIYLLMQKKLYDAKRLAWWSKALIFTITTALMVWIVRSFVESCVIMLQLGFSDKGQDLGFELNQIAETADTSTYKGLTYVLNEAIVAFRRHLEYCTFSSISVVPTFGRDATVSNLLTKLSMDERVKNRETLINVNNMKFQSPTSQKSDNNDLMVTLFVGVIKKKLTINNKHDLESALSILRSIGSSDNLRAVEVLWTPQISSVSACSNMNVKISQF